LSRKTARRDLLRQEAVEIVLQRRHVPRELFDAVERQRADLGILEGDRLAAVPVAADAVEPDDVTEHVVAGHLFAPVLGQDGRLERAQPDGEKRAERFAGPIERVALLELGPHPDQAVELAQLVRTEADRQAQLAHAARRAVRLEVADRNDGGRRSGSGRASRGSGRRCRRCRRGFGGEGHEAGLEAREPVDPFLFATVYSNAVPEAKSDSAARTGLFFRINGFPAYAARCPMSCRRGD
jgi:hypothetical protein